LAPADAPAELREAYFAEIDHILATAPKDVSSPCLIPVFAEAFNRYFSIPDLYADIKREANERALLMLPRLQKTVELSEDPLSTALAISRLGNFMDFSILTAEEVDSKLDEALNSMQNFAINPAELEPFAKDLESAKSLLIIGDNAGEIVFDIVLIQTLQRLYPDLNVTYGVRGGNAQNDATREDAAFVGMDKVTTVIDSGSSIPGTDIRYCSEEFRKAIRNSDVILAKGMGNFETLSGGDVPAYYLFICKCKRLAELLQKPLYTGVLYKELP
jgi:uncharacterized protein with ATP-grasp and redox domains